MGVSRKFLPGAAPSPRRYGGRSTPETAAAASRAAGCDSARAITFITGPKEAPPRSRISPCSVAGTIAPFTRKATSSIDGPTASCCSVAPDGRLLCEVPRPPEMRAVLEDGLAGLIGVREGRSVDVDDHLVSLCRSAGIDAV